MENEYSYLGLDVKKLNSDEDTVKAISTNSNNLPQDDVIELLKKEAVNNNLFALYELSRIYSLEIDPSFDEESAIRYLRKLVDSDIAHRVDAQLWDEGGIFGDMRSDTEYTSDLFAHMYIEDWKISSMIGDAHAKLGYYYKYNSEHKEYAKQNFRAAMVHGFNCCDDYNELAKKNTQPEPQSNISKKKYTKDCVAIERDLVEDFGLNNWNKLNPQSKKSLITSLFCYYQMSSLDEDNIKLIDFSAAVLPALKSLEEELGTRFWFKYIEYCKEQYPNCYDYINENKLSSEDDFRIHSKIISTNSSGSHRYQKKPCQFTLGGFCYFYGMPDFKTGTRPDKTGIEYCARRLLKPGLNNIEYAETMLLQLRKDILSLTKLRNDSAHGGKIISYPDATACFNELLLIKKIFKTLLDICNF